MAKQKPKHDTQLELDVPDIAVKLNVQAKSTPRIDSAEFNADQAVSKHQQGDVDSLTEELSFKKLNPYAPIPIFTSANKASVSFDYPHTAAPQSADGSKRTEMYKGMCYDIDFNGVMGKVGLPQVSPRPCKNNDAILFDKIMDKWNTQKQIW